MDPLTCGMDDSLALRAPTCTTTDLSGTVLALDPASPNWITTDARGARLLELLDGKTPLRNVVSRYAAEMDLDMARAWLHVETFGW